MLYLATHGLKISSPPYLIYTVFLGVVQFLFASTSCFIAQAVRSPDLILFSQTNFIFVARRGCTFVSAGTTVLNDGYCFLQ